MASGRFFPQFLTPEPPRDTRIPGSRGTDRTPGFSPSPGMSCKEEGEGRHRPHLQEGKGGSDSGSRDTHWRELKGSVTAPRSKPGLNVTRNAPPPEMSDAPQKPHLSTYPLGVCFVFSEAAVIFDSRDFSPLEARMKSSTVSFFGGPSQRTQLCAQESVATGCNRR